METVLAFDPGGTTGFALMVPEKKRIVVLKTGEFPDWRMVPDLVNGVGFPKPTAVVYELFNVKRLDVPTIPMETIGVIRYVAELAGLPIKGQPPSMRKSIDAMYGSDIDWARSHAGSAVRHGAVYCIQRWSLGRPAIVKADGFEHLIFKKSR